MIGTQVSGVIKKIYVDFNSNVKKGQLLAEIDKTPLQTQVQQAQASLDDAKSEVEFQMLHMKDIRLCWIKNLWHRLILIRSNIIMKSTGKS